MMIAALMVLGITATAQAENYTLKRVVVTWDDGAVDDSALGIFQANGSMSINGDRIVQDITFCEFDVCDHVVVNSSGTVKSVAKNAAMVTIKLDDGSVIDLTLLTLSPNIITLYVYDDGTIETHEWQQVEPFSKRLEKRTSTDQPTTGAIGKGIAGKLRN